MAAERSQGLGSTINPAFALTQSRTDSEVPYPSDEPYLIQEQNRVESQSPSENQRKIAAAVRTVLTNLGEDPNREGLLKTPERYARAMKFLTHGYQRNVEIETNGAIFNVESNGMVIVRDIEIYSLCEHHLLPFFGKIHIGYIPRGRVLGLSKFVRVVEIFARRLQVQERVTSQVVQAIQRLLEPEGVIAVVECTHLCMAMRGVQRSGATTVTQCSTGVFEKDAGTVKRFHTLLK
ncbi:GTP cyclohydrolase 1 [Lecanosticta acicola]|uniref:GTP cyclohydrolase 1 n=1 Tax=Lecanosticta acicola TaxID=111012 RepID=A0AAI9EE15_9PEZI|nr:GTP cyclohydrolase 1 [Lecanosticta acicola]